MALAFVYILQNLWPFSNLLKSDDLRTSDALVNKLSIPERTKKFVYAVHDSKSGSVVYILSVQNLSERSAADVECLIKEVKPQAVVAQVGNPAVVEDLLEEDRLAGNGCDLVPTSLFGVLRQCFVHKIGKEKYESLAGNLVLREIFGVGFHGHIWTAHRAAREVGSSFLALESPCVGVVGENGCGDEAGERVNMAEGLVSSSLIAKEAGSAVSSSPRTFSLLNDVRSKMAKVLRLNTDAVVQKMGSRRVSEAETALSVNQENIPQVPPFAQSIFPLLVDLHNIFVDIPSLSKSLACSQKMFYDIHRGESMDAGIVSEVCTFRVAVEGLRIALNDAGRVPIRKLRQPSEAGVNFSELPAEEKSDVLLAHALQSQSEKFKTIVAVVDASSLAGLRKHWNTPVPPNIKDLISQLIKDCKSDGEPSNQNDNGWLFSNKPVVAVGAGATAVVGASSLSKVVPLSTVVKATTLKLPVASLKLMFGQTQKAMAFAFTKTGLTANTTAHATSVMKSAASAEKFRTVAHGIITSAERTSFTAMRTAFYEIMRKRSVRPIGFLPWATFGGSLMTLSGLLLCSDGIECVAESFPSAAAVARMGRGIQSLRLASEEVKQTDCNRIHKSIESLMYRLKRVTP